MSANNSLRRLGPVALTLAIACALGACKKDEPAADAAAAGAAQQQAPAPTPESVVSATVAAMSPDQLRDAANSANHAIRNAWTARTAIVLHAGFGNFV